MLSLLEDKSKTDCDCLGVIADIGDTLACDECGLEYDYDGINTKCELCLELEEYARTHCDSCENPLSETELNRGWEVCSSCD